MKFLQRVVDDFKQKNLLSIKLIFFVQASTLYVLYPYLTIHMRELGLNVEETAIMSALTPLVTIIMPPIAGMIADFIGNFKALLAVFSALGGVASLLLLAIPVGRVTVVFPEQAVFRVGCLQDTGSVNLILAEDFTCHPVLNASEARLEIEGQLEACGLVCEKPPSRSQASTEGKAGRTPSKDTQAILRARSYEITLERGPREDVFRYLQDPQDIPYFTARKDGDLDVRNGRILHNKGRFPSSIRQLSHNTFFFPTRGLYGFSCQKEDESRGFSCQTNEAVSGNITAGPPVRFKGALDAQGDGFVLTALQQWGTNSRSDILEAACSEPKVTSTSRVLSVPLLNAENSLIVDKILNMSDCQISCLATIPRKSVCLNVNKIVEYDPQLTFWMYLCVRVFIAMISGTAFAMFEGAAIAILREEKADYGLQRIYAVVGGMISSPLAGLFIDYASRGKGYTDFRPAFYFYAALKTTSAFLMLTINLEFKAPAKNVVADVMEVLRKVEILALLFATFIMGTAWGYIESFLFWLLQDLGASRALMGSTVTVGGLAGLPLLIMSGPIIEKIGHANVLFLGFIFYAIRLVGYSLIVEPWQCLIFEAMESVTSSLAFTAAVTYAAKLSNMSTDSSIQGILGGLYYGVGKGAGGLFGGYLMKAVGTRPTYRIFAIVTLITGCMYYLFNRIYIVGRGISQIGPNFQDAKKIDANHTENSALKNSNHALYYVNEQHSDQNHISEKEENGGGQQKKELKGEINLALENDDGSTDQTATDISKENLPR